MTDQERAKVEELAINELAAEKKITVELMKRMKAAKSYEEFLRYVMDLLAAKDRRIEVLERALRLGLIMLDNIETNLGEKIYSTTEYKAMSQALSGDALGGK